jgi:hypothetical protein
MALRRGAALLRGRLLKILSDEVLAEQHQSKVKAAQAGATQSNSDGMD